MYTVTELLQFNEEEHIYTYGGRVVPGVTSVLYPLYKEELEAIPADTLEAAREFGINVHLATHLYDSGELDEDSLSPPLVSPLNGWKKFLRESGFIVEASEERVYSDRYGYAGTLDKRGRLPKSPCVIDIKSGLVPWCVGAQLAAYEECVQGRNRRLCVQLAPPGLPNDYRVFEQKDPADFQRFLSALNVYRWKAKYRKPIDIGEFE